MYRHTDLKAHVWKIAEPLQVSKKKRKEQTAQQEEKKRRAHTSPSPKKLFRWEEKSHTRKTAQPHQLPGKRNCKTQWCWENGYCAFN